jgi:hypothetical protein
LDIWTLTNTHHQQTDQRFLLKFYTNVSSRLVITSEDYNPFHSGAVLPRRYL